ncbi:hypothetical protein GCM10009639_47490 [Kitasatospora putterlickiae]|uniref:Transposase n=1 Tax=Kitasatospora putterlickiae TaxID=221725 RepID=A0ABN1YD37_9ACTN
MARRTPARVYREVVTGLAKHELTQLPAGWNPLDDYREARAADRAPSVGMLLQIAAVRSTCPCRNCVAHRIGPSVQSA